MWIFLQALFFLEFIVSQGKVIVSLVSFQDSKKHILSVLCIGDIMLDKFIYGEVRRISPESPVPVLNHTHSTSSLGGAGNVIRNLDALCISSHIITVVGQDDTAKIVEKQLGKLPNATFNLIVDPFRKTTEKRRYCALGNGAGQQMLRLDSEDTSFITEEIENDILIAATSQKKKFSALILSDYAKGILTNRLCEELIKLFQDSAFIIVDPKGDDYKKYAGAHLITPNKAELEKAIFSRFPSRIHIPVSSFINDQKNFIQSNVIFEFMQNYNFSNLALTQGETGASLYINSSSLFQKVIHKKAEKREVFDVSGAGDTFIAAFVFGIFEHLKENQANITSTFPQKLLDFALETAVFASGLVVEKRGTSVISKDELWKHLNPFTENESLLNFGSTEKEENDEPTYFCSTRPHTIVEKIALLRRQKKKIVFTNGCFDLLHAGHIHTLKEAKKHGDFLIVGLNTDASVHHLKSSTKTARPIQDEHTRALVLSSLSFVDWVILFDEDTPLALIKCLFPDVLVKGGDYAFSHIVGSDIVLENGGAVKTIPLMRGKSTTKTIEKIMRSS